MQPELGSSSPHECRVGRRFRGHRWRQATQEQAESGKPMAWQRAFLKSSKENSYRESNKEIGLLTPVRMVIIKKSTNNKCWRRYGEKGIFLHCWWECKLVQPLWKTVWRFLKKLKTRVAIYLAMPLLGIYPDKTVTAPLCS